MGKPRWRRPVGGYALLLALAGGPVHAQAPAAPAPAKRAAPKPPPAADEDEVSEVVVTANRPQPGAVVGDIKPEVQLSPADIQSYGVSTVTELLDELAPETRSDRGRGGEAPVVLLNGRRISGFNEIRDIPTEAILRVDILPEEVSLKYGYTANQRVVNIVLRRRFRAVTGEAGGGGPTEGGQATGSAEGDLLHIRGDNRLNLDLKASASTSLLESDRDVTQTSAGQPFSLLGNIVSPTGGEIDPALSALAGRPVTVAGVPASAATSAPTRADFGPTAGVANANDLGRYRTLLPATRSVSANGVLSRALPWRIAGTVNATLGATTSDTRQGLAGLAFILPAGDPFSPFGQDVEVDRYVAGLGALRQSADGWTAHLGTTLNRDLASWRLSLTGAYDHADSTTESDRGADPTALQAQLNARAPGLNPFAPFPSGLVTALPHDTADSQSDSGNVQILANGPLLKVPAGRLYASLKTGDSQSWFASESTRAGLSQSADFARNDYNAQVNLDLPIASAKNHVLGFAGELSLNANAAVDELSDFGVLQTYGYGVNWTPATGVNLIVSHTHDQAAPTQSQLGAPLVATAAVRVFDYASGRTVEVTQLSGGSANLVADTREVTKIGLTLKPLAGQDLTLTANYVISRIDNPIATFPAATAEIEAAFPGRFLRDATGTLVQVDDRPVNFARQDRSELRWGITYSRPIGPQPQRRFAGRFGPNGPARRRDEGGAPRPPEETTAPPDTDRSPRPSSAGDAPDAGDRPQRPPASFGGDGGGGGGRGGGGRGGGFGGGGFGGGGARLQFAVYHTVLFDDRFVVRQGGPVFDLLNGSAASGTGGAPRQEVEAQAGFTLKGFGARASFDWKSGTTVKGATPAGDLDFSDLATLNLRLFANLGQMPNLVKAQPWLRGARVTISVTNLFDQRITVRDATGATPLSYQPDLLDPSGRIARISFRKLFY